MSTETTRVEATSSRVATEESENELWTETNQR